MHNLAKVMGMGLAIVLAALGLSLSAMFGLILGMMA